MRNRAADSFGTPSRIPDSSLKLSVIASPWHKTDIPSFLRFSTGPDTTIARTQKSSGNLILQGGRGGGWQNPLGSTMLTLGGRHRSDEGRYFRFNQRVLTYRPLVLCSMQGLGGLRPIRWTRVLHVFLYHDRQNWLPVIVWPTDLP